MTDWKKQAACRGVDPNVFISPINLDYRGTFQSWNDRQRAAYREKAAAYCRGCLVQAECLAYARANHEHSGVWGGHWFDSKGHPRPL